MENTLQQFSDLNISAELKKGIEELGYVTPTDFQWGVFENFNLGKHVLGEGQSSYGKSLAFLLPILSKIISDGANPQALIICETALQSDLCAKECRALGRHLNIVVSNATVSEPKPHILVWSFEDLQKAPVADLDESIRTVFFDGLSSANMAKAMEVLAGLLSRSVQVLVFGQDAIKTCKNNSEALFSDAVQISNHDQPKITKPAEHFYHVAKDTEPKPRALLAALLVHNPKFAMVSVNDSQDCELLARYLGRYGYKVEIISEENNRSGLRDALKDGMAGNFGVLMCQSSLISGLSLEHVPFMLNYDMLDRPQAYEQITQFNKQASGVHRTIANILTSMEVGCLGPIRAQCLIEIKEMPLPSEDEAMNICVNRIISGLVEEASSVELTQFEVLAEKFLQSKDAHKALALLLRNHLLKPVVKSQEPARAGYDPRDRRSSNGRYQERPRPAARERTREPEADAQPAPAPEASDGISRLYITLGRKDGFMDLASLAQYLSDTSKIDLGHFCGGGMIRDNSAHIEVDEDVSEDIIKALHNSPRPHAHEGDNAVVCERAKGVSRPRPSYNRYQQRRRPNNFQRR